VDSRTYWRESFIIAAEIAEKHHTPFLLPIEELISLSCEQLDSLSRRTLALLRAPKDLNPEQKAPEWKSSGAS